MTIRLLSPILACVLLSASCEGCEPGTCGNAFDCDVGETCVEGACVTVEDDALRIDAFGASPSSIFEGEDVELSWVVEGAERCSINNEVVGCSGTESYTPSTTTTYTLRGEDGAASVSRIVIVTVSPLDAGVPDAGVVDAGVDAGPVDAGPVDAGPVDAGFDAGLVDAGFDAGIVVDAGFDAGPQPPASLTISHGGFHTCASIDADDVTCWGGNLFGQLGLGDTDARGDDETSFPSVSLGVGRIVEAVDTGNTHTCVILDGGEVKCWGNNNFGKLGLGDTDTRGDDETNFPSVDLGVGRTAVAVSAGGDHTCVILDDGGVKCWGYNFYGQLGLGDTGDRGDDETDFSYVNLGTGRTAVDISAGDRHTCAVLNNGEVKCWGDNEFGQLGLGDTDARGDNETVFSAASLGATAASVVCGGRHTCAILDDGGVKCWGENFVGQLGVGDTLHRGDDETAFPTVNLGAGRVAEAVSAGNAHTCAVLDDGSVKCWGVNADGQLGVGDIDDRGDDETDFEAVDLGASRTAIAIGVGGRHTCAVLDNRRVKCWGANSAGELGLGDTAPRGWSGDQMGDSLPEVAIE